MKNKIVCILILASVLTFCACNNKTADNENNVLSTSFISENSQGDIYNKLDLKRFSDKKYKNCETVYVAILDTGVQEAYVQSFYNTNKSCISNILSYSNKSIYSTDSRHGTLIQQFFDEMSISADSLERIKTIHLKLKESDNEKVSVDRIVNLLEQLVEIKKKGINIKVLNVSQSFECNGEDYNKILRQIELLKKNGIITIAAAGNKCDYDVNNNIFAKSKDVLIIGGTNFENYRWVSTNNEGSPINDRIDVYTYATCIRLGDKIPYFSETISGTSFSTLIISWMVANYTSINDSSVEKCCDIIKKASINNKCRLRVMDFNKLYKEIDGK